MTAATLDPSQAVPTNTAPEPDTLAAVAAETNAVMDAIAVELASLKVGSELIAIDDGTRHVITDIKPEQIYLAPVGSDQSVWYLPEEIGNHFTTAALIALTARVNPTTPQPQGDGTQPRETPAVATAAPGEEKPTGPVMPLNAAQNEEATVVKLTAENREPAAEIHHKADQLRIADLEDYQNRIIKAEEAVGEAEGEWDAAKKRAAARKAEYDDAVEELRKVIKDRPGSTLWTQPKAAAKPVDKETPNGSKPFKPEPSPAPVAAEAKPVSSDAWRNESIDGFVANGATGKDVDRLKAHGINTVGDYSDMANKSPDHWHKNIKGLGATGRERLCNAFGTWYINWEQANKPVVAPVSAPAEAKAAATEAAPAQEAAPEPASEPLAGGGAVGGGNLGDMMVAAVAESAEFTGENMIEAHRAADPAFFEGAPAHAVPSDFTPSEKDTAFVEEIRAAKSMQGNTPESLQGLDALEADALAYGVSAKRKRTLNTIKSSLTPGEPPTNDRPAGDDVPADPLNK